VFTVDGVRKFHGWTHACLDLVLDHLSTIPANDYVREVSGFGFRTLREQTIHIFNCEGFWVHTLQGLRYADRTLEDCPVLADVRLLQKERSEPVRMNNDGEIRVHYPKMPISLKCHFRSVTEIWRQTGW
jgi:uncharacterized damage-inducible protein DinB